MKASLAFTCLIIAVFSLVRWKQSERLNLTRETHRLVTAEARALGLSPESIAIAGKSSFSTKRFRDLNDKAVDGKALARDYISFLCESKIAEKSGQPVSKDRSRQWGKEFNDKLAKLDLSQIKAMMAELRASTEIDDERCKLILDASIGMLGEKQPDAALALFMESLDLMKMDDRGQDVVNTLLLKWAEQNPHAALDWLRKTSEKYPVLMTEQAKGAVIGGASKRDPKLALSLIEELKPETTFTAASALSRAAGTAEQRTALLVALREYEKKDAELVKSTLAYLAHELARGNLEANQAWLSSMKLPDQEMKRFVQNLHPGITKGTTGKWLDWMADNLSAQEGPFTISNYVREWAGDDYKAAGEWINARPNGLVKEAAVFSYALVLAPQEPVSAAQWARTLPEGKERNNLVEMIHAYWKQKDPIAAAEFARQNGLAK